MASLNKLARATLSSIATAGPGAGKLETIFQKHLAKVVDNMTDLSGDQSTRKITVEIEFKPAGQKSSVDSVEVGFTVKSKLAGEYGTLHMVPHGGRDLMFNPTSPDNARQGTLDQAEAND